MSDFEDKAPVKAAPLADPAVGFSIPRAPLREEASRFISATLAALAETGHDLNAKLNETLRPHPKPLSGAETPIPEGGAVVRTGLIGEGGTATVYSGIQRGFAREVAIKEARSDVKNADEILLHEAWTLSQLEHPNIVPVYALIDDEDQPVQIVMRRVPGISWGEILANPKAASKVADEAELQVLHLKILMQVANALDFAHSKAIIHRDLKPDNVLLGPFGEVYLIDWGLAVTLDPERHPRLPRPIESEHVVGTPLYLAPEMARGDNEALSPRTDVYLLGATLYEILAGHPPHQSESLMSALISSQRPPPPLPVDTFPDLAEICAKAMAIDPADRFESAAALRLALREHIRHRQAFRIAARAHEDLAALKALDPADKGRRQRLFGACRFGFKQALMIRPDFKEARRGLQEAQLEMVQAALDAKEHATALQFLREIESPTPSAELNLRVLRAGALEGRAEEKRHAEIGSRYDPSPGAATRAWLFAAMGVWWASVPIIDGVKEAVPPFRDAIIGNGIGGLLVLLLAWFYRKRLWSNVVNRTTIGLVILSTWGLVLLDAACLHLGLDESTGYTIHLVFNLSLVAIACFLLDPRFFAALLFYGGCFALSLRWPTWLMLWTGLGNLGAVLTAFWAWKAREKRRASAS